LGRSATEKKNLTGNLVTAIAEVSQKVLSANRHFRIAWHI